MHLGYQEFTSSGLPPLQRMHVEDEGIAEARYMARMDIQKAILNSDVNNLKSAVERAKEAGLSQPRRCLFPTIVAYSKDETHRECAMKRKLDECEIILYYRNSCKVFVDYLLTEVTASSMCVDALFV